MSTWCGVSQPRSGGLVDLRRALTQREAARPVRALDVLLTRRLNRHKAHARALHRLTDRLGIETIVIVRFDLRLDKLRGHHSYLVTPLAKGLSPIVRPATGFHPDQACRQSRHRSNATKIESS